MANGTDAIALCLRGLDLENGDEVITTSHTAVATVAGIEQAGCTPVFADIDPITRCIDPKSVRERVGSSTRAIMPVHIYGQPAEMNTILEIAQDYNLAVIEIAAGTWSGNQWTKVGTFADILPALPDQKLGGTGDGGVIADPKSLPKNKVCSSIRLNEARESIISGYNSRLDELGQSSYRSSYYTS